MLVRASGQALVCEAKAMPMRRGAPPTGACGAVVLAAGSGSRFAGHTHKLLTPLAGVPMIQRVLSAVVESHLSPVIVVTGAVDLSGELSRFEEACDLVVVHNPRWQHGMASSLHVAFAEARRRGLAAVVVGLGDQPGVPASAWRRVADTEAALAVATYDGVRRNPVRVHAELWDRIPPEGDEGARVLMRLHPELVSEVACEGNADDIDTTDDVERWQRQLSARGGNH